MLRRYSTRHAFRCRICKSNGITRNFSNREDLIAHYDHIHRREIFPCDRCSEILISQFEKNTHLKKNPTHCRHQERVPSTGICGICSTCLHYAVDVDVRCIVCDIRMYKCDYCQERFNSEEKRDIHLIENPDHCVHPDVNSRGRCINCNKNLNACITCERNVIFRSEEDRTRHYKDVHGFDINEYDQPDLLF